MGRDLGHLSRFHVRPPSGEYLLNVGHRRGGHVAHRGDVEVLGRDLAFGQHALPAGQARPESETSSCAASNGSGPPSDLRCADPLTRPGHRLGFLTAPVTRHAGADRGGRLPLLAAIGFGRADGGDAGLCDGAIPVAGCRAAAVEGPPVAGRRGVRGVGVDGGAGCADVRWSRSPFRRRPSPSSRPRGRSAGAATPVGR